MISYVWTSRTQLLLCLRKSPYPHRIEVDSHNVPSEGCWYACPQLFFKCTLRSKNGRNFKKAQESNLQIRPGWPSILPGILQHLWGAHVAHQVADHAADGWRWDDQAVWTTPNTVSLRAMAVYLLWPRTWWVGSPLFQCFWRVIQHQDPSNIQQAQRLGLFRMVALTLLLQTEGCAAMSTRLTPGCGSLGAASPAWVVWQSKRLLRGGELHAMQGSSVDGKLANIEWRIWPDSKWKVVVTFLWAYV